MTEVIYDFESWRRPVMQKAREYFLDAVKRGEDVGLEKLCSHILEHMGLPPRCALGDEVLDWLENIYQLKFLKEPLLNPELQELILHSPKIFQIQTKIREYGQIEKLGEDDFQMALEIFAQRHHQSWNYARPFCSFQAKIFDRSFRVTLCHSCLTPAKNSKAFFRALRPQVFSLQDFGIEEQTASFFEESLKQKKNMLLVGPTGSGKTTFLHLLTKSICPSEHVIILEDTHELFDNDQSTTHLLAGDGKEKSLEQYCAYALRMKPDRLIVGEIRSGEVVPFLLACNTGHKGLMASVHANSAADALTRLALLFQIYSPQKGLSFPEVLKLICQGIETIVYVESKRVVEIIQVLGSEGDTPYYKRII